MNEIEIYTTTDNQTEIQVRFDGETVWLNQYQLAVDSSFFNYCGFR